MSEVAPDAQAIYSALGTLAGHAKSLADAITKVHEAFNSAGEPLSIHGFRLGDAAGMVREAAGELRATIADLDRLAARPEGSCQMQRGTCPDHGGWLASSGGETWCRFPSCGRRWDYDRVSFPCAEPATHRVADLEGTSLLVCDGHAIEASERLEGARVVRLGEGGQR